MYEQFVQMHQKNLRRLGVSPNESAKLEKSIQ